MKNREKYKNELMDVIKMDGRICGFVKKHDVFRMIGTGWDNVPVDTLVRVRARDEEEWILRYFKGTGDKNSPYRYAVWASGATSKTTNGDYTYWKYCELVEDEDNDK